MMDDEMRGWRRRSNADPEDPVARFRHQRAQERAKSIKKGVPPCPRCGSFDLMMKSSEMKKSLPFEGFDGILDLTFFVCSECMCGAIGACPSTKEAEDGDGPSLSGDDEWRPLNMRHPRYPVTTGVGNSFRILAALRPGEICARPVRWDDPGPLNCHLRRGHSGGHVALHGDFVVSESQHSARCGVFHNHRRCELIEDHEGPHVIRQSFTPLSGG